MKRQQFLGAALAATAFSALQALPGAALAQGWPARPIRIVTPFPAGQGPDVLLRNLADKLGPALGQPVVIENKPGASGFIAFQAAKAAPADGYTLVHMDSFHIGTQPHLFSKLPYKLGDFAPVVDLAELQMVLSLSKATPAGNVAELVTLAKEQPGKLNYGSFGVGNIVHLSMESFQKMAGIKLVHVPYKGYPDAIRDVIANQVQIVLGGVGGPVLQHLKSGAMKPVAVTGRARSPLLPQVPTFAEAGYRGFNPSVSFILMAPAGTPPAVVNRINATAAKVVREEIAASVLVPNGMTPLGHKPAELLKSLEAGRAAYAEMVSSSGVKLD